MSPRPRLDVVRKAQIRAAAAEVIAEQGLAATRVADIARRAGTSSSAIIYWFSDKDRLLAESLTLKDEQFYARLEVELGRCATAGERLAVVLREILYHYDWRLWLEICARALHDETTAATRRAIDRRWRAMLMTIIQEGADSGEFADVDTALEVLPIAGMLDGLCLQVVLSDPAVDRDSVAQIWLDRVGGWLGTELPAVADRGAPAAAGSDSVASRSRVQS